MPNTSSCPLKIIFAGTPEFSVDALQFLLDSEHEVVGVYTQPDRPAGRGRKITASPVKTIAEQANIAVYQPENFKDPNTWQHMASLQADVMVVVAYGLILPQKVLDIPTYGCLNIHASILPRWRGAAPIQRAIESGDPETGVTIMQMDAGLDTGDILAMLTTEITANDTSQSLHDRLKVLGSTALMQTLHEIQAQTLHPVKQDESFATYANKMSKLEAEIDWSQPVMTVARKIQAFNPWPVAFTLCQGKPLRIWEAMSACEPLLRPDKDRLHALHVDKTDVDYDTSTKENAEINPQKTSKNTTDLPGMVVSVQKTGIKIQCGDGVLNLVTVQPTGKKAMSAYDFALSRKLEGTILGHKQSAE